MLTATQHAAWVTRVTALLLNKRIVDVRFMSSADMEAHDWEAGPVMFQLNTGEWVDPSQDDEGNGPGSLFTTSDTLPIIPALDAAPGGA